MTKIKPKGTNCLGQQHYACGQRVANTNVSMTLTNLGSTTNLLKASVLWHVTQVHFQMLVQNEGIWVRFPLSILLSIPPCLTTI